MLAQISNSVEFSAVVIIKLLCAGSSRASKEMALLSICEICAHTNTCGVSPRTDRDFSFHRSSKLDFIMDETVLPTEIHQKLVEVHKKSTSSFPSITKVAAGFKRDRTSLENNLREGQPGMTTAMAMRSVPKVSYLPSYLRAKLLNDLCRT